jgi:hypothetical protein
VTLSGGLNTMTEIDNATRLQLPAGGLVQGVLQGNLGSLVNRLMDKLTANEGQMGTPPASMGPPSGWQQLGGNVQVPTVSSTILSAAAAIPGYIAGLAARLMGRTLNFQPANNLGNDGTGRGELPYGTISQTGGDLGLTFKLSAAGAALEYAMNWRRPPPRRARPTSSTRRT